MTMPNLAASSAEVQLMMDNATEQHSVHDRKDNKEVAMHMHDLQRNFLENRFRGGRGEGHGGGTTLNSGEQSPTIATESDDPDTDAARFKRLKEGMSSGVLLGTSGFECGGGKIENTITVNSDRNYHMS